MASAVRSLLPLCLAPALVAQAPKAPTAAFKLIPASASAVEFTWRPADADPRYRAATTKLGDKSGLVDLEGRAHLGLADLAPGTLVEIHFTNPAEARKAGKKPAAADLAKAREWKVLMAPVKDAKQLAAKLHAKADGPVQRYQWKAAKGTQERFLAFRGGYALVAEGREMLDLALKAGPSLEAELTPLAPWLMAHDTVFLATEASVRKAMDDLVQGEAQLGPLKELAEKARASVHHAALALDLPEDGSLRVTARAFFKPGSPLAADAAALPALSGHPLGRLPEGPYALAMGGLWPLSMGFLKQAASQYPGLEAKDREEALALMTKLDALQRGLAFRLRGPRSGEAFLQGLSGTAELTDGPAWMAAMRQQQTWNQAHLGGAFSFEEGVLADLPSLTVHMDLAKLTEGKVPPAQVAMFSGLLFGGNRLSVSYAVVDATTLAYTFGGREALKALVAEVQQRKPLAGTKGIQAADALAPKDSRFLVYLDPAGFRAAASTAIQLFTGKAPEFAAMEEVVPLVGAVSMDPAGFQLCGSAHPKSLEAMARIFSEASKTLPKPPAKGEPAAAE